MPATIPRRRRKSMHLTERSRPSAAGLVLLACLALAPSALLAGGAADNPHHDWPNFEVGLTPMYVIGDLNDDGVVDLKDRAMLAAIAGSPSSPTPGSVSCLAAGDLNFDGRVDRKDLEMLDRWLKPMPRLKVPALGYQATLPCSFSHAIVAARYDAHPGERVPIRFLERGLNSTNSTLILNSGPATVQASKDGGGYDVITSSSAKPGDTVTVLLTLPHGMRYLYTYPVIGAP
jgi:hypothetical protein